MRLAQTQILINLQVQLNEELPFLLDGGQVMNREAQALGRRANRFE